MWFLLIACALLAVGNGEMRLCSSQVYSVCREPSPHYSVIPGNENELRSLCPPLIDHLECLHSYDVACKGRSEYTGLSPPLYYSRIKGLIDDVCDETSSLHRTLGRSLPCIKRRVHRRDFICSYANEKALEAYEDYLATHTNRNSKRVQAKKECLSLITTVACMMEDIEKECGFLAYDAANDIAIRSQIFADECSLDIFQKLKAEIDDLNLDTSMKTKLKKYFVVEVE